MNIKSKISIISLLMLGVACGAKPTTWAVTQSIRAYSVGLKEMAANQLYLNDSVDSIGASNAADGVVTPELAAAKVKLDSAKLALDKADKVLADAAEVSAAALATAKASTKVALDLAQAAKADASLQDEAADADAKARADGSLINVAEKAEQKAQVAQRAAADAVVQAEKVFVAQGGVINGAVGAVVGRDALSKAQGDLRAAQDALALAKATSQEAKLEAKALKDQARDLAKAALADANLQAQADLAAVASDAAVLKVNAAVEAEALLAAEVAKATAALAAAEEALDVNGDADEVIDPVTEADAKPNRIGQMVAQLFLTLDVNADDALDLTEFLGITEVKNGAGSNGALNAEKLAKLEAKLTAKFAQFAGADNLMNDVELAAFLQGQKGRVCKIRKQQGQAGASNRALSAEQLLAKFDANTDGVIDLAELTAMRAAISPGKGRRN